MVKSSIALSLIFVLTLILSGCPAAMPAGDSGAAPVADATEQAGMEDPTAEAMADATEEPAEEPTAEPMAEATEAPAEEPTAEAVEEAVESVVLRQGEFRDRDPEHRGSGTATLVQMGDEHILKLENFESSDGPDLYVYLVENPNTLEASELGETLDLGLLQSLTGDQEYVLPAGTDVSVYQGAIIFCLEFDFVFSTAPFAN